MKWRKCDQFAADLFDAGHEYGLTLDPTLAQRLLMIFSTYFRGHNYKESRNRALDTHELAEDERDAYKLFLDRFYQRRARAALEERRNWPPFATVDEDGN